ncbi:MAG TPA: hypothetical protein VE909_07815, partial [Xanthobacteraceae bacterium]|nr:hypothetical protein [Xanthobacteraceae bacterium]
MDTKSWKPRPEKLGFDALKTNFDDLEPTRCHRGSRTMTMHSCLLAAAAAAALMMFPAASRAENFSDAQRSEIERII